MVGALRPRRGRPCRMRGASRRHVRQHKAAAGPNRHLARGDRRIGKATFGDGLCAASRGTAASLAGQSWRDEPRYQGRWSAGGAVRPRRPGSGGRRREAAGGKSAARRPPPGVRNPALRAERWRGRDRGRLRKARRRGEGRSGTAPLWRSLLPVGKGEAGRAGRAPFLAQAPRLHRGGGLSGRRGDASLLFLLDRDGFFGGFNMCFDEPDSAVWIRSVGGAGS